MIQMKNGELGCTQGAGVRETEKLCEVTSTVEECGQTDLTLLLLKVLGGDQMPVTCRFRRELITYKDAQHRRTSSWTHTGSVGLSTGLAQAWSPCSPQNLDRRTTTSSMASQGSCEQTESSRISQG